MSSEGRGGTLVSTEMPSLPSFKKGSFCTDLFPNTLNVKCIKCGRPDPLPTPLTSRHGLSPLPVGARALDVSRVGGPSPAGVPGAGGGAPGGRRAGRRGGAARQPRRRPPGARGGGTGDGRGAAGRGPGGGRHTARGPAHGRMAAGLGLVVVGLRRVLPEIDRFWCLFL